MRHIVEALLVVWPRGIPANEIERALTLAGKMGALAPSLRAPVPALVEVAAHKRRPRNSATVSNRGKIVSDETADRVRKFLSTGPATAQDIVDVTGLSRFSVWAALKSVGVVKEKNMFGRTSGAPTFVYVLKES